MKNFLPAQEVTILREAHHASRFRKQADRIKALLFLNDGFTYEETAKLLMLDDTTVRRYRKEYHEKGIDGLLEDHYTGSLSFLTGEQQSELTVYLRVHTYQTVKEITACIESRYNLTYSVEGVTNLLHRLGFVYKKTKRIPGKLDPVKQEEFIKSYEEIKAAKNPNDKIYFLDATHPQHNNMPFYGWIYKGDVKTIKANSGRKRLNLNGALNIENLEVIVREEPTINTQAMINLFTEIEVKQPEGIIYCIADNASCNHSYELKDFLKVHPRLKLIFLPSYSPNLNPIERLWLFLQKKQLYDHYYETFKEFREAVLNFFQNLGPYQRELKSLLTDSFQTIAA